MFPLHSEPSFNCGREGSDFVVESNSSDDVLGTPTEKLASLISSALVEILLEKSGILTPGALTGLLTATRTGTRNLARD